MGSENDVREPLEIPRETLLATLQENLDKAKAEREEAHAKVNADLAEFKDFVSAHQDEVAGYLAASFGFTTWSDLQKQVERLFEDRDYKPVGVKPTKKEGALEKYVRVLSLASNKSILVQPGDDLYPLL